MWYKVVKTGELAEGQGRQVEAGTKLVALFFYRGQFYALRDQCTHAGAPLNGGEIRDFCVRCPSHGAEFDVRTGQSIGELAYNNVRVYKTRVVGDDVEVEIP